jgi:hypothetical protein
MSRRLTAAQLERRQKFAAARELYYKNKPASTLTTVRKRSIRKAAYYSYSIAKAGASTIMSVPISEAALLFFGGTSDAAGLLKLGLKPVSSITDPIIDVPSGFKPAQISVMVGAATPGAKVSPWGTRVIKYSAATTGTSQAFYTAPICNDATNTFAEVDDKANALYISLVAASKLGELDYARFYVKPERFTSSKN